MNPNEIRQAMVAHMQATGRPIPAGAGFEPQGPPTAAEAEYLRGYVGDGDPWFRLRQRILGAAGQSAAQYLAEYELRRRNYPPATVIPRPLLVSERIAAAVNGDNVLVWDFPTLCVVTGVSMQFYGPDGEGLGNCLVVVRAGSDGGYIIGTDTNPVAGGALANIPAVESGVPRSLQPTQAHPNNQWTGRLICAALSGDPAPTVDITFYGVALWQPSGQIL